MKKYITGLGVLALLVSVAVPFISVASFSPCVITATPYSLPIGETPQNVTFNIMGNTGITGIHGSITIPMLITSPTNTLTVTLPNGIGSCSGSINGTMSGGHHVMPV